MPYLESVSDISAIVAKYTNAQILWIDTEVADYQSKHPQLSLIQVLDNPTDMSGQYIYILDVLDKNDVIADFIDKIMVNPGIEKVFHHASYDVQFLGKKKAKNITCTLNMAKKIPYYLLPVPNYQLKTLAQKLCNFQQINKTEQTSDWGQRPLSTEQIEYAYLDCIYLAQVHMHLLELENQVCPDPTQEDLILLTQRYTQIEEQFKLINSEFEHLQERIKKTMQAQNISETSDLKLTSYERQTMKASFTELAKLVEAQNIHLDFPVTLTQKLQKDLGEYINLLSSLEKSKTTAWRLNTKNQIDNT